MTNTSEHVLGKNIKQKFALLMYACRFVPGHFSAFQSA